jgi:hypothetical protein
MGRHPILFFTYYKYRYEKLTCFEFPISAIELCNTLLSVILQYVGMHWISGLFDIRYLDGYQITLPDIWPDIRQGWIPDVRLLFS